MSLHPRLGQDLANCSYCPKLCRFACPVAEATANEALTPRAKMLAQALARAGDLPVDAELGRLQHACLSCYACEPYCELGNDVPASLAEGRALVAAAGHAPPAAAQVLAHLERSGNPHGEALDARVVAQLDGQLGPAGAPIVYFPSCHAAHDGQGLAPLVAVLRAVAPDELRVDAGPVRCCGRPLLELGRDPVDHARRVAAQLGGACLVLTDDSACAACLGRYQALGVSLPGRVTHVVPFLATRRARLTALLATLPATPRAAGVVGHVPCWLARHIPEATAARAAFFDLLAVVAEPAARDPVWHGADTGCCGGLLTALIDPALAQAVADWRVADLAASGATSVVTACPTCQRNLAGRGLPVYDLIGLLAERLRGAPGPVLT